MFRYNEFELLPRTSDADETPKFEYCIKMVRTESSEKPSIFMRCCRPAPESDDDEEDYDTVTGFGGIEDESVNKKDSDDEKEGDYIAYKS